MLRIILCNALGTIWITGIKTMLAVYKARIYLAVQSLYSSQGFLRLFLATLNLKAETREGTFLVYCMHYFRVLTYFKISLSFELIPHPRSINITQFKSVQHMDIIKSQTDFMFSFLVND